MNQIEATAGIESIETPKEMGPGQEGERKRWLAELQIADKNDKTWRERADKVVRRYRDERDDIDTKLSKMNILWSNTQTILPALYAQTPAPMVDRRNKKRDPVGLMAARVLEQAAECALDDFDFDDVLECAVEDYQLPGRAVMRVFYRPEFVMQRMPAKPVGYQQDFLPNYADPDNPIPTQGEPIYAEGVEWDDAGPYTMEEVLDYEAAELDYVFWKDFRMGRAKKWKQVPWVGFRAYLTKEQVTDRFGAAIANTMRFKHRPDDEKGAIRTAEDEGVELLMKCEVWEIWDKVEGKVIWVSPDYADGLLDKADPHMKLAGFFPCTKPLIMGSTTSSMIPVPEYVQYQDQADEVDDLTNRIAILVKAIRVAGVYDQSMAGLEHLLTTDYNENKLFPIANWAQFMDKGGLDRAVGWLPIEQMVNVVKVLYEAREAAIQKIYEITGIADIVRGASDPNETATAQGIKGRFASMRLRDKQKLVAQFAREGIQLLVEVMSENFSKETLQAMTGITYESEQRQQAADNPGQQAMGQPQPQQLPANVVAMPGMQQQAPQPDPQMLQRQQAAIQEAQNEAMWDQVMELLRNDPMRRFRIAIETDSTIQPDEFEEKQKRIEFLESSGTFMRGAIELIAADRSLTPLITEMLMFGVRGFRAGRELEERFQEVMDQINTAASKPQQEPQDPAMIKAQAEIQRDQAKAQISQQESQAKLQLDQQKNAAELQHMQQKNALELAHMDAKANREMRMATIKEQGELRKQDHERNMASVQIEVARAGKPETPAPQAPPTFNFTMPEIELPEINVNVESGGDQNVEVEYDDDGKIRSINKRSS